MSIVELFSNRRRAIDTEVLQSEYQRLIAIIDAKYEVQDFDGIEELEEKAECLLETLSSYYEQHQSEYEPDESNVVGFLGSVGTGPEAYFSDWEKIIAATYAQGVTPSLGERKYWIDNMRESIRSWIKDYKREISDEQVLEIAKDCYEREKSLRERIKKGPADWVKERDKDV